MISEDISDSPIITLPTLEKWKAVQASWEKFLENTQDTDNFVHFLIQVDSFSGYCDAMGLIDLKPKLASLENLLSSYESGTSMTPIQSQMEGITAVIGFLGNTSSRSVDDMVFQTKGERIKDHPKNVVIFSPDAEYANEISIQLEHYGYHTLIYEDIRGATVAAVVTKKADAALFDISGQTQEDLDAALPQLKNSGIPWVALSMEDSFHSRLKTVRNGSASYFVKPVAASVLADMIDSITNVDKKVDPYRILVVDDSMDLGHFVKNILNDAGMTTWSISDPSHIMEAIYEFYPDLILLDMNQSYCSDVEIAKIIRQNENHVSTPIVFLSGETNKNIQLEALRFGGDDFLIKPIQEEHLIASVTHKAERYRLLRKIMVQDSLTGLLNHTRTKQKLAQALSLAEKESQSVVFAMLDIDHFKKVNDTYGHPVGDVVIKALARLLRQRVRKTDVVGRYGGEEFAVVLYGVTGEQAMQIMDRIRLDFAGLYHHYDGGIFASTFSCGIAAYPDFSDALQMGLQADEALYVSKRGGRNRVTLAKPTAVAKQ
jgi:diguanylate cyclase (GGDEF)-like protein